MDDRVGDPVMPDKVIFLVATVMDLFALFRIVARLIHPKIDVVLANCPIVIA